MKKAMLMGIAVGLMCTIASAATETVSGSVSFTSDLEGDKILSVPSFDTTDTTGCGVGEYRELQSVTVTITYDGSCDIAGDNDDDFQPATMNARIIRTFFANGGGVASFGTKTVQSPAINVLADDGDDGAFDATAPDGHAFGILSFTDELAGVYTPTASLYETAGPGTVDLTVTPATMVNDLQFIVNPDSWQLEVQNPLMVVEAEVVYDYICVPEPATLALLAVGALIRRKR